MRFICLLILIVIPLWAIIYRWLDNASHRFAKTVNFILFVMAVGGVIYATLINRENKDYSVNLVPFQSFVAAKSEFDIYRSMLMNVFLFVPFGLTCPRVFPSRLKKSPILITVASAMIMTVIIEFLQYKLSIGQCETDDVIFNTVGAMLGSLSYIPEVFRND